jgi:hypothetical protein
MGTVHRAIGAFTSAVIAHGIAEGGIGDADSGKKNTQTPQHDDVIYTDRNGEEHRNARVIHTDREVRLICSCVHSGVTIGFPGVPASHLVHQASAVLLYGHVEPRERKWHESLTVATLMKELLGRPIPMDAVVRFTQMGVDYGTLEAVWEDRDGHAVCSTLGGYELIPRKEYL